MLTAVRHMEFPAWCGLCQKGDDYDLREIKAALAYRGINARGWRLYLDYGDDLFKPLRGLWIQPFVSQNNAIYAVIWLRILQHCEMDVPPPPELVQSMQHWRLPGNGFGYTPPLFFRATWKACMAAIYAGYNLEAFLWDEIIPVAQWLFDSEVYQSIETGQLKAGWPTIHRLYENWQLEFNSSHYQRDEWPPFVRWLEWGAYRFQALSSQSALRLESRVMQHCIDTYAYDCQYGTTRAYSIRDCQSGQRIGTLSMVCNAEEEVPSWSVGDLKGPGNTDLPGDVLEAAEALIRCYEDIPSDIFASYFESLRIFRRNLRSSGRCDEEDDCEIIF